MEFNYIQYRLTNSFMLHYNSLKIAGIKISRVLQPIKSDTYLHQTQKYTGTTYRKVIPLDRPQTLKLRMFLHVFV